jgi:hypothetical protein
MSYGAHSNDFLFVECKYTCLYGTRKADLKEMDFSSIRTSPTLYSWMISSRITFLKRKGKSLPPSKD